MGFGFIFITLGGQHANGPRPVDAPQRMAERQEQGYIDLQRREWEPATTSRPVPTTSSSGVPYHHLVGQAYDAAPTRAGVR